MARERYVTRTVNSAKLTVMTCDTFSATIENREYVISATIAPEKRLEYVKKHFDTDTVKAVSILACEIVETLYGMPEADFIKLARILPPRKVGETD